MHDKRKLEAAFVLAGKSKQEVAAELGITADSLYRKINQGPFKLDEINKLVEILGIDDPVSIFFTNIVAGKGTI